MQVMKISNEELADRVHELTFHLLRWVRAADSESRLGGSRLSVLSLLVLGGPRTVGELAAAEQVSAPTVSRLVTALEREGYVKREPDAADGRRVRVVVTGAGVQAAEEARSRRVARLAVLLEGMDRGGRAGLVEAVERIEGALEDELELFG